MDFLQLVLFVLPAYVANSAPVLLGGKTPVDLGLKLDKERIFGGHKTVKGFVAGVVAGTLAAVFLAALNLFPLGAGFNDQVFLGFVLSLGAMAGDLLGSFTKRRLRLKPGAPLLLLDQLPFLFIALLFAWFVSAPLWREIGLFGFGFLAVLTLVLHAAFNWLAHNLNLKRVPW